MAIKVSNTTVIDDSINLVNVQSITFDDASVQTTAAGGGAGGTIVHDGGSLLLTIDNPNAYDTSASDNFGYALDATSDLIAVGAYGEDQASGSTSGKVYIFDRLTGNLRTTITNPSFLNSVAGDLFGREVAMHGKYLAVSAINEDQSFANQGIVYIFDSYTGAHLHTLTPPTPEQYGNFGQFLSVYGKYTVVGVPYQPVATADGIVYVYNNETGELIYTLNDPNAYGTSASDLFGSAVAAYGNYLVVSAQNEGDAGGAGSGKAYVFQLSDGTLLNTIDNPNAYSTSASDTFGEGGAVDAYGNYFIVGARQEDDAGGTSSGKAYIFNIETGALVHTLDNPNAYGTSASDVFGASVAISSKYAAVGAYQEDDAGGTNSGKVYVFDIATGDLVNTIDNPNAYSTSLNDNFASANALAMSGDYVVAGAYNEDDTGGTTSGKVYVLAAGDIISADNVDEIVFDNGYTLPSTHKLFQPSLAGGELVHTLDNPNAYSTSNNDRFGESAAIDGNYAIVCARFEDDAGGSDSGKAYIFDVTTGSLLYTLDNPNAYDTSGSDNFGLSVGISGNHAILGAPYEDDASGANSGKAYIFNVRTGKLVHTLNNPNPYGTSASDTFGHSVSISGNYAIVGAFSEDDAGGTSSGKAYIFNVTTGVLVYTLNNPNAYSTSASDFFGNSVSISGNYAIIAAFGEDDAGGAESGKAYIFDVTTGDLLHTLNNPNAYSTSLNDAFGYSASISGNYAIVGAYQEDDAGGQAAGKAYIFDVTTGALVHTLDDPNAYSTSTSDTFGIIVSISGKYAIVGASGENDASGTSSGKAYIYDVTTGTLLHTLDNPNAYGTSASDYFGNSVSISGNYAVASAFFEDDATGSSVGKAYIFSVTDQTVADRLLTLAKS